MFKGGAADLERRDRRARAAAAKSSDVGPNAPAQSCARFRFRNDCEITWTSSRPPRPPSFLQKQILLRADAAATVAVLGEALSGWDAVETDLRAAAGRPAQELDSVLVASQVCVWVARGDMLGLFC